MRMHPHRSHTFVLTHRAHTLSHCQPLSNVQIIRNAATNGMSKGVSDCDTNPQIMFDHDKLVKVRWTALMPFMHVCNLKYFRFPSCIFHVTP